MLYAKKSYKLLVASNWGKSIIVHKHSGSKNSYKLLVTPKKTECFALKNPYKLLVVKSINLDF